MVIVGEFVLTVIGTGAEVVTSPAVSAAMA
jgi:hypothetical protein